ncbi:hypothetical protein [uncultured Desulfobacter sp.]|uniref:hypothetical protein n=1 Tax=uncultured Desulfobacter sp. TaxID=240139 RepID=UPI0029C68883|nr:hypothetical protein [uncultured Desulfobacter sp.]
MHPIPLIRKICGKRLPERVIIRVDAGAVAGLSFGHLSRCLVLAKALKKTYHSDVCLVMADYPEGIAHALQSKLPVLKLPQNASLDEKEKIWLQKTADFRPDWTFIDLPYPFSFSTICRALKRLGSKILFIDDTRFANPGAEVFLNSSILACANTCQKASAKYLLGPEYFIFDYIKKKVPKNLLPGEKKILISFGGSDPSGLSHSVADALNTLPLPPTTNISLVMGPGFKKKHASVALHLKRTPGIHLIDSPQSIYPYFQNADLVFCAGGRTLYELNELNIQAFPIASIDHEKPIVEAFIRQGIITAGMAVWDKTKFIKKTTLLMKKLS